MFIKYYCVFCLIYLAYFEITNKVLCDLIARNKFNHNKCIGAASISEQIIFQRNDKCRKCVYQKWKKSKRIISSSSPSCVEIFSHFNSSSVRKKSRRRWEKCKSRNPVFIIFFPFYCCFATKKIKQPPLIPIAKQHPQTTMKIFLLYLFIPFSFLFGFVQSMTQWRSVRTTSFLREGRR